MTITKERLQALIDNPIDERIMNYERSDILKMALSSIELHTDSLQNYRESLEAYQGYIKSLQAENARLREALEFYADRKNWKFESYKNDCKDVIDFSDIGVKSYNEDADFVCGSGGRRAREALNSKNNT